MLGRGALTKQELPGHFSRLLSKQEWDMLSGANRKRCSFVEQVSNVDSDGLALQLLGSEASMMFSNIRRDERNPPRR